MELCSCTCRILDFFITWQMFPQVLGLERIKRLEALSKHFWTFYWFFPFFRSHHSAWQFLSTWPWDLSSVRRSIGSVIWSCCPSTPLPSIYASNFRSAFRLLSCLGLALRLSWAILAFPQDFISRLRFVGKATFRRSFCDWQYWVIHRACVLITAARGDVGESQLFCYQSSMLYMLPMCLIRWRKSSSLKRTLLQSITSLTCWSVFLELLWVQVFARELGLERQILRVDFLASPFGKWSRSAASSYAPIFFAYSDDPLAQVCMG